MTIDQKYMIIKFHWGLEAFRFVGFFQTFAAVKAKTFNARHCFRIDGQNHFEQCFVPKHSLKRRNSFKVFYCVSAFLFSKTSKFFGVTRLFLTLLIHGNHKEKVTKARFLLWKIHRKERLRQKKNPVLLSNVSSLRLSSEFYDEASLWRTCSIASCWFVFVLIRRMTVVLSTLWVRNTILGPQLKHSIGRSLGRPHPARSFFCLLTWLGSFDAA